MIRFFAALALLLVGVLPAAAQKGIPTQQIDQTGASRCVYIWDLTKPGADKGVSTGCINTGAHTWNPVATVSPLSTDDSTLLATTAWVKQFFPTLTTDVNSTGVPGIGNDTFYFNYAPELLNSPGPDAVPTLRIDRRPSGTGGTSATLTYSLLSNVYVPPNDAYYETAGTFILFNQALRTTGAENQALNATAFQQGAGADLAKAWGADIQCIDQTGVNNPQGGCIALELDNDPQSATTDTNRTRIILSLQQAGSSGSHVSQALQVNTAAGTVIDEVMYVDGAGTYGTGIDLSHATFTGNQVQLVGLNIDQYGHLVNTGSAPTASSCGTSPAAAGSDTAGQVSGSFATCTITFAHSFPGIPQIVLTPASGISGYCYIVTRSSGGFSFGCSATFTTVSWTAIQ